MAGIAGLILKQQFDEIGNYHSVFEKMLQMLAVSESQKRGFYTHSHYFFGNVVPLSRQINDHFQHNSLLNIYCVVDGLVFINEDEKSIIQNRYSVIQKDSDYGLIPYLYDIYKADLVHHITGWYNIFLFDYSNDEKLLFNDRLGYLPLYYYETDNFFLFASKIESLLATELIPKIEFDITTISEHLFFNYPLSDHSYIKDINTLPNATIVNFSNQKASKIKYWSMGELFDYTAVDLTESLHLMNNGLQQAVNKILFQHEKKLNFSLTGGWDSRLLLSYFLPEFKDRINLYSFGANNSDDITTPQYISNKEHLNYSAFILDQEYLNKCFMPNAQQTIKLSSGTRNYKRSHYLYAIQKMANTSDVLISGIFGDEVLKVSQALGGDVLSHNLVSLIESDFDIDQTLIKFASTSFLNFLKQNPHALIEEFADRLEVIKNNLCTFDTKSKKYYSIRFELNLRKYFGNEVNSYNDFAYCFSPFIDYDFLNNFAHTKFMGTRYSFNSNSIKLKKQSTLLYCKIINDNYAPLNYYNSDRGYSMHDATTMKGYFKIFFSKYIKNRIKAIDGFNTKPTDRIFLNCIKSMKNKNEDILSFTDLFKGFKNASDINSLYYWINYISDRYQ